MASTCRVEHEPSDTNCRNAGADIVHVDVWLKNITFVVDTNVIISIVEYVFISVGKTTP